MVSVDTYNFQGKKALIRVDFNVPLNENFEITDDTRIRATLPTLHKILSDGGSIILMSHLGRPKDGPEEKFSLKHLVSTLSEKLNTTIKFASNCVGDEAKELAGNLQSGEALLLENLRFHKEEKKGDEKFAKQLSELGDVYVNDAFGTAHRAHASTSTIAQYFTDTMFGYVMASEIENANKLMSNAEKPFTAIMGGAKVSDKILLIENLMDKVDNLLIGGGMVYTFFKAQGFEIGNSLVEDDKVELAGSLIQKAKDKGVNLLFPLDSIIADDFSNDANSKITEDQNIENDWMGLDIGPKSISSFIDVIENSKTILWNGPVGVFEMEKFSNGTRAVAEAIANATSNGAFSLIGGGDSASAINNLGFSDKVSYISTGGGALLEYIEGKELPGIKAIIGQVTA
ncbi:MAG: phosphoglycerate kinase [Bacteroidetes bacterium]|nr:MAG: phosphoglycerate kinase [Bacteroidota bacterium]